MIEWLETRYASLGLKSHDEHNYDNHTSPSGFFFHLTKDAPFILLLICLAMSERECDAERHKVSSSKRPGDFSWIGTRLFFIDWEANIML